MTLNTFLISIGFLILETFTSSKIKSPIPKLSKYFKAPKLNRGPKVPDLFAL